jgi:hypothetical protein
MTQCHDALSDRRYMTANIDSFRTSLARYSHATGFGAAATDLRLNGVLPPTAKK